MLQNKKVKKRIHEKYKKKFDKRLLQLRECVVLHSEKAIHVLLIFVAKINPFTLFIGAPYNI